MSIAPGWYKDPVEPTIQRWWDGEGWIGEALPADATPPPGPPPAAAPTAGEPSGAESAASAHAGQAAPVGQAGPVAPAREDPSHTGSVGLPAGPGIPPGHVPAPGGPPAPGAPPPQPHGYQLATLEDRLAARMIDFGLLALLNVVINGWFVYRYLSDPTVTEFSRGLLAGESLADLPDTSQAQTYLLVSLIIGAALWFAYEIPAVANTGQTPGKRLLGIMVVRLETGPHANLGSTPAQPTLPPPLGFGRSFRRWNTMGLPTLLWWCAGIGLLMQLVDFGYAFFDRPLRQALHDKSAHTVVVALPPEPSREKPDAPTDPS